MNDIVILVVDDEPLAADYLVKTLKFLGCSVLASYSGHAALETLTEHNVDIMLTDILMPDMDGLQLIKEAKTLHPELQSMVITGHGNIDSAVTATNIGVVNYFQKPMDSKQLKAAVRQCIDKIKLQRQLKKYQDELEAKVVERTKNLQEERLNLQEANNALNVLLKKMARDRTETAKQVMASVTDLIVPYLEKLKKTSLDDRQHLFLGIIEKNMLEITSPFAQKLSFNGAKLTPTELKVANLVQHGNSIKEIATTMSLSPETIKQHRKKIRAKLGLTNTRLNLQTSLNEYA